MDENTNQSTCKDNSSVIDGTQLQAEVEHLRQHLAERDGHIVTLEAEFLKSTKRINQLEEQVDIWREKYERLYESHKRVQKLNQVLEDKLLQMVDKMKSEKSQLTKDIATLSVRLAESKHNYSMLQKENERYKNDMNLAIQLLQCKPDNFVSQKLDNLPVDTQARVSQYVMSKTAKPPCSTQSKISTDQDTFDASEYEFNISASIMTKILEDSIQDSVTKHCDTCTCTRTHNKPFCYNESYYSVATQTLSSGEINNYLCTNCSAEIQPANSNVANVSPNNDKFVDEKHSSVLVVTSTHTIPQSLAHVFADQFKIAQEPVVPPTKPNLIVKETTKLPERPERLVQLNLEKVPVPKLEEKATLKKNGSMTMEPAVHHKLCDHTKNSISSKLSSTQSVGNDDLLVKDAMNTKCTKANSEHQFGDNMGLRKNSQSSMGALSRTSSVAKSTVSTHKSGNQVGPGPRFCHLRVQAGSKNILLDNAEPDVPPVLYRRQSKSIENSIFKDFNDDMENFIDLGKTDDEIKNEVKNDNGVAETTLIDVHVDNNKENNTSEKDTAINPVLMNVSSSPLQPLKTHTFSNGSENNNNPPQSVCSQQNNSEIDNLLGDFNHIGKNDLENNNENTETLKNNVSPPINDNNVKIFNFDHYEQSKLASQYSRPLRKIDMSQLHSIENTKISKDLPPVDNNKDKIDKKDAVKPSLPAVVNVYPNLTQTHLKVNESKKVFTNEHSTSSLSSDDSAALMQKQQLLRVAEWVEQNLEQQNNFNDPLEDEFNFNKIIRGDNKLTQLTETLNEVALNMPHPVSKYSKTCRRDANTTLVHNLSTSSTLNKKAEPHGTETTKLVNNIIKETIFPVESDSATVTEVNNHRSDVSSMSNATKEFCDSLKPNSDKEISPEDLARMEYNVKKFLLSRPQWANPGSVERSRRTSSKTETDV